MSCHTVTLFEGDGIGPEITRQFIRVTKALGTDMDFEMFPIGLTAFEKYGVLIPEEAADSIRRNGTALKAPVTTPVGHGFRSVNVQLRTMFDLYINFRPATSIPNTKSRYSNIDIVTFRENTEDLYIGEEYEIPGGFHAVKRITAACSTRIAEAAFEYASSHNRKKVTCVHKANILKKTDGLFLDTFRDVGRRYPDIESDDKIIDNMCMQLVMNPNQFDVLVAPNLYGDIITDLIAGLVGGLGMAPAANIGRDAAIFEAVHGSAPDIAGRNIANPTAFFLSGALMLDHIGEYQAAGKLRKAIFDVYDRGTVMPIDANGNAGTEEFTDAVIKQIGS